MQVGIYTINSLNSTDFQLSTVIHFPTKFCANVSLNDVMRWHKRSLSVVHKGLAASHMNGRVRLAIIHESCAGQIEGWRWEFYGLHEGLQCVF